MSRENFLGLEFYLLPGYLLVEGAGRVGLDADE